MQWEKTTGREVHCCEGTINGVPARFTVHTGRIETGRSRMFIGYFASVEIDGEPVTGADSSGIVFALRNCAEKLRARGVVLDAPALSERFYESGLSENSGWGYMRDGDDEPVHYIDRTKKYTRPPRYDSKS